MLNISETVQDTAIVTMNANRKLYPSFRMVPFSMTLSDLERLSEIFHDTKRRAVSLLQSFLFYSKWRTLDDIFVRLPRDSNTTLVGQAETELSNIS